MSVTIRFDDGQEGEALALDGERLSLVSPRAFAPGEPMRLELALPDTPLAVAAKSGGSRLRDDRRFDVIARLVSCRRSDRDRLARALSPAGGSRG
jgi:hypothetical protein